MILLTDEEIEAAYADGLEHGAPFTKIAKAQLKKVAEWGNEECPHDVRNGMNPKRKCTECWQSLLDEVRKC